MINLYKVLFYLEFSGLITVVEANSLRENQQIRNRPVWRNYLRLQKKKKKSLSKIPNRKEKYVRSSSKGRRRSLHKAQT